MIEHISLYRTIVNTMKELGDFSVIPLNGKKPHNQIKTWEKWQRQQPDIEQVQEWFTNNDVEAYGIITGSVSNGLVVIDFDKIRRYREFKKQFPEIAQTFTVKTRRGKHVYLRVSTPIKSKRFKGGDIQAEGHYVVGPGSIVNNYQYEVEKANQIKHLNDNQMQKVQTWLIGVKERTDQQVKLEIKQGQVKNLQSVYQKEVPKIGRNNALYKIANTAKRAGITQQETVSKLAELHVKTKPIGQHESETNQTRYREAINTIQSAFNGTTVLNPQRIYKEETQGLVPNAIREAFLKEYKSTIPGRLLEACLKEEWQAGQRFTIEDAKRVGKKYKIGEKQIRETITGKYNKTTKGTHIYKEISRVPIVKRDTPVRDTDNVTKKSDSSSVEKVPDIQILEQFVPNHIVSCGGRSPQLFVFPDMDYLCHSFGVIPLASDYLRTQDLLSSKSYLMALHRELILRLSPEYSIEWHAKRLGVSQRTIRRYNKELGVIVTPIFEYRHLNWDNVDDSDFWQSSLRINCNGQDITPGQWIQRSDGKRFPATKGIALDWMARSHDEFVMCYRRPSRLQLPQADHPIVVHDAIWRCLDTIDRPEWGGGEYAFPPINKSAAIPSSTKTDPIPTDIGSSTPVNEPDIASILGLKIREDGIGLLDNIPPAGFEARQRLGIITYERLNLSLQLIGGLGPSRIEQLNNRGIFTLEQVIILGSERLFSMVPWRGREYLSLATCEKWVEEAQLLLGWKQRDPKVIAEEKRRQEAQKIVRDYKKNVQRFIDYLTSIRAWEDDIFGTGDREVLSWNMLLDWFMTLMQRSEANPVHFIDPRTVDIVHKKIREFCLFYQERIDLFLEKADWELEDYALGLRKKWKALKRATARQLTRFASNDIWIGWN